MTEYPEAPKEMYELCIKQIDLEQSNELRDKLKKTKARYETYALVVCLSGFLLFQLVSRFPDVDWASVGILWFMSTMLFGFFMR